MNAMNRGRPPKESDGTELQRHDQQGGKQRGRAEDKSLAPVHAANAIPKSIEAIRDRAHENREERAEPGEEQLVARPEPELTSPRDPDGQRLARERLRQSHVGKTPEVRPVAVADEVRRHADGGIGAVRVREVVRVDGASADGEDHNRRDNQMRRGHAKRFGAPARCASRRTARAPPESPRRAALSRRPARAR